jgi:LysM repeat protein
MSSISSDLIALGGSMPLTPLQGATPRVGRMNGDHVDHVDPPPVPEPENTSPPESVSPESSSTSTPPGGAPATSSGGTRVFDNLEGRDPDYLMVGETVRIEVNGQVKTHVVKAGETLTSIGGDYGVSVQALIKTNKMDASLLGTNSQGQYFSTSGGPQPSPGGIVQAPSGTSPTSPNQPTTPAQQAAPTAQPRPKTELETLLENIDAVADQMTPEHANEMRALVKKAMGTEPLTQAEKEKLEEYEHDVKAMLTLQPSQPTALV